MDFNFEVFEGKTFSDLLKEIHKNSSDKKQQIELLISEVTSFMTDADTAVQIVPLIAQYLEVGVKNDEQLVKLAVVVQRLFRRCLNVLRFCIPLDTSVCCVDIDNITCRGVVVKKKVKLFLPPEYQCHPYGSYILDYPQTNELYTKAPPLLVRCQQRHRAGFR